MSKLKITLSQDDKPDAHLIIDLDDWKAQQDWIEKKEAELMPPWIKTFLSKHDPHGEKPSALDNR